MDSNSDEIQRVIGDIGLGPALFCRLSSDSAQHVYETALRHFVPQGHPRWWWEHFPASTGVHYDDGAGWKRLTGIVPDADEKVWLIVDDFVGPGYSVWESTVRHIQQVLGECYHFEYYLINQQLRWLVCENHHNVVVAVGPEVEERLRGLDGA